MITHDDPHPQEWHDKRRRGIGGSEWQHILNIPPYGCARYLVYHKRDIEPDYPKVTTGAMRRGHALEPVAADEFVRVTGATVVDPIEPTRILSLKEWWIGNIDRTLIPDGPFAEADGLGVLELKTKAPQMMMKLHREGIPEGELLQVQHYLTLTGRWWGAYFALDVLDFDRSYMGVIQHDADLEAQMLTAGERFWKQVTEGPLPDRLEPEDNRCRKCIYRDTCQGERMLFIAPAIEGDYVECCDPCLPELIQEHEELKRLSKDIKDLKKAKQQEIQDLTGAGKWQDLSGLRTVVAQRQRVALDQAQLKSEMPEIYEKYKKPGNPFWDVRTYGARKSLLMQTVVYCLCQRSEVTELTLQPRTTGMRGSNGDTSISYHLCTR